MPRLQGADVARDNFLCEQVCVLLPIKIWKHFRAEEDRDDDAGGYGEPFDGRRASNESWFLLDFRRKRGTDAVAKARGRRFVKVSGAQGLSHALLIAKFARATRA